LGGYDAPGVDPGVIINAVSGQQRFGLFTDFLGERFDGHAEPPSYGVRIVQGFLSVKTGDIGKVDKLQKCPKTTIYFTLM
jgi:hypothetical protein